MQDSNTIQNESQWSAVLETLQGALSKGQYTTHFLGSTASFTANTVTVSLPPSANLPMVENQLQAQVFRAVQSATGQAYAVRFTQGAKTRARTVEQVSASEIADNDKPIGVKDKRKKPGFFMVENGLFNEGHAAKMKPNAMAVYFCLLMHAGQDAECWPSYAVIAREIGVSRPTAIKGIKLLVSLGYVEAQHQYNDKGEFTSNLFIILDSSNISIV